MALDGGGGLQWLAMPTLGDVFKELNALKNERIVSDYALGEATAVLFYAEPTRTFDVDVFVRLASAGRSGLVSGTIYDWARQRGFPEKSAHVLIHQVRAQGRLLVREKVRILLALQRQGLPLIRRHRPLEPWEEPWAIEP
ncbi:MAG: hypothetical protein ACRD1V_15510 [Vicinamibacterales bacterium]